MPSRTQLLIYGIHPHPLSVATEPPLPHTSTAKSHEELLHWELECVSVIMCQLSVLVLRYSDVVCHCGSHQFGQFVRSQVSSASSSAYAGHYSNTLHAYAGRNFRSIAIATATRPLLGDFPMRPPTDDFRCALDEQLPGYAAHATISNTTYQSSARRLPTM